MTKYLETKNPWNKPIDIPVVAGEEEWYSESRPPYICDFCHHTLVKLQDRSGLNQSWYCNNCHQEYDPDLEAELRTKSKISMSEGPVTNPSVAYAPDRTLTRKAKEIKGGLKTLQARGINITSYKEGKG
jgi:hypothetical protein